MSTILRRTAVAVATAGAVGIAVAGPAAAHHCFIPMYTLDGPRSPNWFVVSAEDGAALEAGYEAECEGAVQAGYDALEAAGLPVAIKIFEKMTIGDPKGTGRTNPNGANGVGLEYFADGSPVPFQMVGTWMAAAEAYDC